MNWEIIAYSAATITVLGFLFAIIRKIVNSYKSVIERLSKVESALEINQKFKIAKDCWVATESEKLIPVDGDTEFTLIDTIPDSNIVKGKIFHDEVIVYVDKSYLKETEE